MKNLLAFIRDRVCQERPELFLQKDTMYCFLNLIDVKWDRRPGILILINELDWELEGGIDYIAKDGDNLVFISTLHGG